MSKKKGTVKTTRPTPQGETIKSLTGITSIGKKPTSSGGSASGTGKK